jgi:hypothetical protein
MTRCSGTDSQPWLERLREVSRSFGMLTGD